MAAAEYFAMRIMEGALDYAYVISRRPDLKTNIDFVLISKGRIDLIKN